MPTRTPSTTQHHPATKGPKNSRPKKRTTNQSPASRDAPGNGWVEPKPSGRYRGRYYNPSTRTKPGETFDTWEEADAWQIRQRKALFGIYEDQGIKLPTFRRKDTRLTFTEVWNEWWSRHKSNSVATLNSYRNHARQLDKFFGETQIDVISEDQIRCWLAAARTTFNPDGSRKWSETTLNTRWSVLKNVLAYAAAKGYRHGNPCSEFSAPQVGNYNFRVLTEQELCLMTYYLPYNLWLTALIAHDCGLRAGEVLGMRWANIKLDVPGHEVITVADVMQSDGTMRGYPKGKTILTIPLSARAAAALLELRGTGADRKPDQQTVITDGHGQPVKYPVLQREWAKARVKAGMDGSDGPAPTFHDLRHTCATNLARAKTPVYIMMAIMRHTKADQSLRYVKAAGGGEMRFYLDQVEQAQTAPMQPVTLAQMRGSVDQSTPTVPSGAVPVQPPREDGALPGSRRPADRGPAAPAGLSRTRLGRRSAVGASAPGRRPGRVAGRRATRT
ncbi:MULTISPECIES: tyrosine-type recombinase/integrase [unclassified Crossiella]|uniref:tyrosine-type recombinase/integrase n=1 Tax=unclassified Crossiella TaxID=2620835 RepID=UPI0020005B21|nr:MULTISPECIES: tyrosine-type recombinase/integrase [unclassified Crossiella]MCK2242342.1 site-specific integrase [Crossiella sp. S99.2]MCK2254627.1 site-specific integrase [Crossiella sp. S99.1]